MTQPTAVPPEHWGGRLSDLLAHLTAELDVRKADSAAALIRSGYTVSLTRGADNLRRCRIACETRPRKGDLIAWNRFADDMVHFQVHLGILCWAVVAGEPGAGAAREWVERLATQ